MNSQHIRVTHLAKSLSFGGTSKALEVLVRNLDSDCFESSVIGIETGGQRADQLRSEGYDVRVLDEDSNFGSAVRDTDPDIIHYHGSGLDREFASQLASLDVDSVVVTDNFGWPNRSQLKEVADRWFFNSNMTRFRYARLLKPSDTAFNRRKYRRIYYPLSNNDLSADQDHTIRRELEIPAGTPVVGQVSRPGGTTKWSDVSTDALRRVVKTVEDVVLIMLNPPDKVREQFTESNIADRVKCIEAIDPHDMHTFYDSIDVLAHTSNIGESFGYVIAESLARGTPVIVNSTPMRDNAQIELVRNGKTGFVANSTDSFAEAVTHLLRNDERRAEFGRSAAEESGRLFSPDRICKSYERQYRQLVCDDPSNARPGDDTRSLEAFAPEYQARLTDSFGSDSLTYRLERLAWEMISNHVPAYQYPLYHLLRYREIPDPSEIRWS